MREIDASRTAFGDDSRFTGVVSGTHIAPHEDPELHAYVVHFEAGGRTAWHCHDRGQLLICIDGSGFVGARDGSIITLQPGVAAWTAPAEDHWHGASAHSSMTHVAVQTETAGAHSVDWKEPVGDLSGPLTARRAPSACPASVIEP